MGISVFFLVGCDSLFIGHSPVSVLFMKLGLVFLDLYTPALTN